MSHLQYTAKSHHLQWDMKPLKQFCTLIYRQYSPKLLRERHNIKLCKTKDSSILVLLFLQVELGIRSQRKFYRMCQLFIGSSGLERTRFYRRTKYLLPLFKLIRQALTKRISKDELVIVDSFPLPVCLPVRNFKTRIFRDEQADISFNSAKQMWFYGFKVHMLVTLSGYVVNYLVTPASTHDSKACEELLEDTNFTIILADLGYISQSLKQRLAQK